MFYSPNIKINVIWRVLNKDKDGSQTFSYILSPNILSGYPVQLIFS